MSTLVEFGAAVHSALFAKQAAPRGDIDMSGLNMPASPAVNGAGLSPEIAELLKFRNVTSPPVPAQENPWTAGEASGWAGAPQRWKGTSGVIDLTKPQPQGFSLPTFSLDNGPRNIARIGAWMDRNFGTNTGMHPDQIDALAQKDFRQRIHDSGTAQTIREVGRIADDATDPSKGGIPYAASRALDRAVENSGSGAPPPAPTAQPTKPVLASLQNYGSGLTNWAKSNPMLAGGLALGLGGLGAYGLYDLIRSRRRRNRPAYYDYDAREF